LRAREGDWEDEYMQSSSQFRYLLNIPDSHNVN
jgi:hypothetical protein